MKTVTVLPRQTLWDIAVEHCGSADAAPDIARLNGITPTKRLHAGQRIVVPEPLNRTNTRLYAEHLTVPATCTSADGASAWTFLWADPLCAQEPLWYAFHWTEPLCAEADPYTFHWTEPFCQEVEGPYTFLWTEPLCHQANDAWTFLWADPLCAQAQPYAFHWTNALCVQQCNFEFHWTNALCAEQCNFEFRWTNALCAEQYDYELIWEPVDDGDQPQTNQ